MPYSLPDNIPDYIKGIPQGAQRIFVDVFNEAVADNKSEDDARQAAWGAVKNAYEKQGEDWVKKATELDVGTLAAAYALHAQLHLEYGNIQLGQRRKADVQGKHALVVAEILDNGGLHVVKNNDALDETLPHELRGVITARYITPIVTDPRLLEDFITLDDKPLKSRIQVLRTGTFYHPVYGKFTIDGDSLAAMVENYQLKRPKRPTEMVIDYEHMSAPGQPVQPAPAAGWVKGVEQQGESLYCFVEWTPKAVEFIRNKEYRFISPEFTLNYRDKETNKTIGPALLALALTNRPFMEGMQPVVLSDDVGEMAFALSETAIGKMLRMAESLDEQSGAVRNAYYAQFPQDDAGQPRTEYIVDIYPDLVIVENAGEFFKVGYTTDSTTGKITFDTERIKVVRKKEYTPVEASSQQLADWDTQYINDLPDEAFAYIRPGGEKDEQGKTVPRSLRFLPYKNMDGSVNLPHLRNALARLQQTSLSPEEQSKAAVVLEQAAKAEEVGQEEETKSSKEVLTLDEATVRELLGIGPEDSIEEAIKALIAKAEAAEEKAEEATTELSNRKAEDGKSEALRLVEQAIADRKLLPKQKDNAVAMCLKDMEGFTALLAEAPVIGPQLGEKGNAGNNLEVTITATEKAIASRMGVTDEQLLRVKQEDAVAAG